MSTSSLSFKQQRKLVTDFIKAHAKHLTGITNTFFTKLDNANDKEFVELIENIRINAHDNFLVFSDCTSRKQLQVWITDKPVDCIFDWERTGLFKNITPIRMSNLERLFASIFKKKTAAKKPTKSKTKTKKIDSNKSKSCIHVKHKIAFIDVSDKSIQHAMFANSADNIDICWSSADLCDDHNSIDNVINSYNCAIKEFRSIIAELKLAKANGATHVIDSTYSKPEHFNF